MPGTPPHPSGSDHPRWDGGRSTHPLYKTYHAMLSRCLRQNDPAWPSYGGRGITVCQSWRDDFWVFVADVGERPTGHSLNRINNDGPYAPDNVRWATRVEQNSNRRLRTHCGAGHEYPNPPKRDRRGRRRCGVCAVRYTQSYRERQAADQEVPA